MSLQTNFLDMLSATSSPESASGLSPRAEPVSLTASRSGPVPAHASLSARQALATGLLTIATSGRTGIGSSRSAALTQLWASRLRAKTALLGSTLYRLTWKDRITPAGRSIFALRASGRPISVSGFSCAGWPTPVAHGSSGGEYRDPEKAIARATGDHANDLRDFAQLAGWATASARDWKDTPGMATVAENPDGSERSRLDQLPRQAMLTGWTTPQAHDTNPRGAGNRTNPAAGNACLAWDAKETMLSGWPTPTATDSIKGGEVSARPGMMGLSEMMSGVRGPYAIRCEVRQTASGPVLNGYSVETLTDQNSGLLDPAHSAWLQGIPDEMVSCVRMAMQSTSKSRRRGSKKSAPK